MPGIRAARALDDVAESDQVGIDVRAGILDRIAHAGLGREMHHGIETALREQPGDAFPVDDVDFFKFETGVGAQARQPRLFQTDVVIVVEVVNADDAVAARQQPQRKGRTNEACSSGYEYLHVSRVTLTFCILIEGL